MRHRGGSQGHGREPIRRLITVIGTRLPMSVMKSTELDSTGSAQWPSGQCRLSPARVSPSAFLLIRKKTTDRCTLCPAGRPWPRHRRRRPRMTGGLGAPPRRDKSRARMFDENSSTRAAALCAMRHGANDDDITTGHVPYRCMSLKLAVEGVRILNHVGVE